MVVEDYIGDVGHHGTRVAGIIAVGIEYAADMGAAILQNSWGEPSFCGYDVMKIMVAR